MSTPFDRTAGELLAESDYVGLVWASWHYALENQWILHVFFGLLICWRCCLSAPSKRNFPEYPNARITKIENIGEFRKFVDSNENCIIDFYATWCPPCARAVVPYGKLSEEYTDRGVAFAKCDVDHARDVVFHADIKSMPTFKVYKNGKETLTVQGFRPAEIEDAVKKVAGPKIVNEAEKPEKAE